jgi:hypothetical protein
MVSWPSNVVGHLPAQINPGGASLNTNWSDLTQSSNQQQRLLPVAFALTFALRQTSAAEIQNCAAAFFILR